MRSILLVSLFFIASLSLLSAQSVIISEFHYDNTGNDTGEAIEVTGPANIDLAGYKIALYRNTGTVYKTINLSGTFADQDSGFGALAFFTAPIQNGPADGIALVNPAGTVLQFISYVGTTTASEGPANGQTSTDIGVRESGTTPVDFSLSYDGQWNAPAMASFGTVNPGLAAFLPVTLTDLRATTGEKKVTISWSTANESENEFFALERSTDGIDFREIARQNGAGNSNVMRNYHLEDRNPAAGTNYYRLRQTDFGGRFTYYGPVAAKVSGIADEASVFPNPANDHLTIAGLSREIESVTLLSANGRVLSTVSDGSTRVNTGQLAPGIYLLRVTTDKGISNLRFTKQ